MEKCEICRKDITLHDFHVIVREGVTGDYYHKSCYDNLTGQSAVRSLLEYQPVCGDCGSKNLRGYNIEKGLICCADCGQFVELKWYKRVAPQAEVSTQEGKSRCDNYCCENKKPTEPEESEVEVITLDGGKFNFEIRIEENTEAVKGLTVALNRLAKEIKLKGKS